MKSRGNSVRLGAPKALNSVRPSWKPRVLGVAIVRVLRALQLFERTLEQEMMNAVQYFWSVLIRVTGRPGIVHKNERYAVVTIVKTNIAVFQVVRCTIIATIRIQTC